MRATGQASLKTVMTRYFSQLKQAAESGEKKIA